MALNLGKVASHVQNSADALAAMFRISTVGGYRAKGSVPGSDHPKGLAADFMTDRAKGDQLTNYLLRPENWSKHNVKYVIWNRRYYDKPGGAGVAYTGPSPHTDHVHVSYAEGGTWGPHSGAVAAGAGFDPLGGLVAPLTAAGNALGGIATATTSVGALASKLMWFALPSTWTRIVSGALGIGFLFVGVRFLMTEGRT